MIRERLRVVRALRYLIAENAELLAHAAGAVSGRPLAEKLVSEVLPLADACRWLERHATRVLAPRRCGSRGRPFWLQGLTFEVQRQPFGKMLMIGPRNYPLFLPAVHSLHALVAGNSVLLKPAPGTREVALAFAGLAQQAGFDPKLLTVLQDDTAAGQEAIAAGVDKVIFTGSSENGRAVLVQLAETNTPSVMELSGEDAVIVLEDADLNLVRRALGFGSRLNGGETCIAPRRILAVEAVADQLSAHVKVERVRDADAVFELVNAANFALGASIFSRDLVKARALAERLKTGFVIINDLIVPTADPRMPFGGVKASGFGVTRGDEGLLEMTFPHVVAVRRGNLRPHFDAPGEGDTHLFTTYIRAAHGRQPFTAARAFLGALLQKSRIGRS